MTGPGFVIEGTALAAAFATAVAAANYVTWWVTRRYMLTRYDTHTYRQVYVDTASVKAIEETAHELVHEARTEAKAQVGDLLDRYVQLERRPRRITRTARYPLDYGAHR